MIKSALYCFVSKLVVHLSGAKGGRDCGVGKGRGSVKCNMSCLYVCWKKKFLKKI